MATPSGRILPYSTLCRIGFCSGRGGLLHELLLGARHFPAFQMCQVRRCRWEERSEGGWELGGLNPFVVNQ